MPARTEYFEYPFVQCCRVTIPGTLHQLGTGMLAVVVTDDRYPRQEISTAHATLTLSTHDVTVLFPDPSTGVIQLTVIPPPMEDRH